MLLPSPRVVAVAAIAVARVASAADANCPSSAAIAAELGRLPDSGAIALLWRSEVTAEGDTLRILLRDRAGQVLGVREIEVPRDCRQRAAVAALVLAAWSHEWIEPASAVAAATPSVAPPGRRAELGLEGDVHRDGTGMAPGATVLAGLQLSGPFDAGVFAGFAARREQQLGPGAVEYSLARAGAGLVYRTQPGATWIDAGLFPFVGRLGVTPRSLPAARAVALWAGGLEARVRLGLTWRRLMPFVAGSVGRTFVRDRLTLEDVPEPAAISPWDLHVGIGLAASLGGENR